MTGKTAMDASKARLEKTPPAQGSQNGNIHKTKTLCALLQITSIELNIT